jgi:hypothetical protein
MHRESRSLAVVVLLALPVLLSASQAPRDHVREFNQWADRWADERSERAERLEREWREWRERQQEREQRLDARLKELLD